MANDKDTIYIDVDDEITGIIDKVQGSSGKVVALVLPKRAAVFQSIVNMKLLKRAADSADKNLALITTEAGLLPLAGVAGIHVAKTLNSKPEIPSAPKLAEDAEEAVEEDGSPAEVTAAAAGGKAVGDLAKPPSDNGVETLTLDDATLPPESIDDKPKPKTFEPPAGKGKSKGKKDKKLKIPDFNRFRLLLIGGVLLFILLIIFLILAVKVLPKAVITIDTGAQQFKSNLTLNLSPTATTLDPNNFIVPSKLAQQQKTYSQEVATTGQKNNGTKASGSISMTATENGSQTPATVPAGTGVSSNGQTYITQSDTTFSDNGHNNHNGTFTYQATDATTIIAQNPGSSYNGATSFSVAGRSDVSASVSSAIAGGTDNIVHSVNQNDINNAKAKINTSDPSVKQDLESQLKGAGYFVIEATYSAGTPVVIQSANVGAVADNVTVTETVSYLLYGVHKSDLDTLVTNDVDTQIDTSKQKIQDTGVTKANFNVTTESTASAQVTMTAPAVAGPDINIPDIQKNAAGQQAGKIKGDLEGNPGIKSVNVKLSPFWVTTAPKKTSKIKVVIAQPKTASNSNANQ